MHHFITGVAGFIGSHLADFLLARGFRVSGVDDLSGGRLELLEQASHNPDFRFFQGDISDSAVACTVLRAASEWGGPADIIWHLAANSDIAAGSADPSVDFRKTLLTTYAILAAAKAERCRAVAFASTSAVYGERPDVLFEDSGPLLPVSNYGATKLASEALLSAAAELFLERVWIFRFPNVVAPRPTHGAIFDFIRQVAMQAQSLKVLGDGMQTKPYLHVSELISAMMFIVETTSSPRNVFNIGPAGPGTSVEFIAQQVVARTRPGLPIVYTGGDRGWVGDVPRFLYSTERLSRLGWRPQLSSEESVRRAIDEIAGSYGF